MPENTDFNKAIDFVLSSEGGYVNDPRDPGGETNFGISKRAFPNLDIKNLTRDQAKKIYFDKYWIKSGCDKLSWPLNLVVMDTAVNCGVERAKEMLQEVSSENQTVKDMAKDMVFRRLNHYLKIYKANKALKVYIIGWLTRSLSLYDALLK